MRIIRLPGDSPPEHLPEVVATIGSFDGVHRGHRSLISTVMRRASELGVSSAVITFEPHPRLVLRPESGLHLLSIVEEKAELFEAQGVDFLLIWRFDDVLRNTEPEQFFVDLGRYVRLRSLVHGPGFALGKGRRGTPEVLAQIGRHRGFEVLEVDPYERAEGGSTSDADLLTSTSIRAMLQAGQVEEAAWGLSRPPTICGIVIEGERVGRTLGFPTANLAVEPQMAVPADGVYAAWAEIDPFTPQARRYPAAVSIGTRPTFDGSQRAIEAFLLDFDGDLYGRRLRLHIIARTRGQERFNTLDSLVEQMHQDVARTRNILSGEETSVPASRGDARRPEPTAPALRRG